MPHAIGATVALAPAAPGWTVTVTSPASGDPVSCPIVAWASVVVGTTTDGEERTEIQPAFVLERDVWTFHHLNKVIETVHRINPPSGAAS
jgi:hypothetical protein